MPDDLNSPWWLRIIPTLFPHDTPTIDEQLRCPPGTRRGRPGEGCVPDGVSGDQQGRLVEVPGDAFVGPVPTPRVPLPPKVPTAPPPAPPAPDPVLPRAPAPSPADMSTGRYFPRGAAGATATTAGLLLYVLGAGVIGPYLGYGWRERSFFDPLPRNAGPPRRRRPRTVATPDEFPFGEDPYAPYRPMPRFPATGLPIPLPRRLPNAPFGLPDVRTTPPRTVPTRPRAVPGTQTPVRGLPAPSPTGWTLGNPIPGPGYDPYTYAPPTPRTAPRPTPRTRNPVRLPFWSPFGLPFGEPAPVPGTRVPRPLTPQPTTRAPPRVRLPPPPRLTPLQDPVPHSLAQPQGKPSEANPCTAQREARRKRSRDCKRYTTKTIRVCADK